jgi:hypothetical protein
MSTRKRADTIAPPVVSVPTFHVAVRLDESTLARVDALCPSLSAAWHQARRSDALRAVILAGLPVVEAAYPPKQNDPKKEGPR